MKNQELQNKYVEYQLLVNQLKQLEQQVILMDQHLAELRNIDEAVDVLVNSDEKEMLSSVGGGVYVKSELKDKKNVLINVGAGVVVKKDIKDAKGLVIKQIDEVQNLLLQLEDDFEKLNEELNLLREEINRSQK